MRVNKINHSVMLVLIFTFIVACSNLENTVDISINENGLNKNDKIYNVYSPLYLQDAFPKEVIIKYADELLNNNLIVNEKISDYVKYDIDNIDWDIDATESPNTFSLYLHSLRPVYYLSRAYLETNDLKYVVAAQKFVTSWSEYDKNIRKKNRYTWYDHSVAERTENLIYFSIIYQSIQEQDENILNLTNDLVNLNAKWLFDDKNYVQKHNHGIFEDGSLIKTGHYLNNNDYINKGVSRLDEQLKFAFPNKAVHIENSIGYHMGIISYLKNLYGFLDNFDITYSDTLLEYYNGALDFLVYINKPNLTTPYIGDTIGAESNNTINSLNNMNNKYLDYVFSKGTKGDRPEFTKKVYIEDGYSILRESWDSSNFEQSTWLLFKSGYLSSTHKHADDLSLLLYSKGHDIFIDPGMYNYMVGDPLHDYLNSSLAHNTVTVDDNSYSVSMFNSRKVGLYEFENFDGYDKLTGFNNIYPGVNIDRSIAYVNENEFFIIDDIVSVDEHKYSQIYHLSNDVELLENNLNYSVIKIKGTNYSVLLQQLNGSENVNVYAGNENDKYLSYVSNKLNSVIPTKTMVFDKVGKSDKFITSVKIIKDEEVDFYIENKPIYINEEIISNNIVIDTQSRERLPEMNVDVQIMNNEIVIQNNVSYNQAIGFAYYLLDKETGKKYVSNSFSFDNKATFELEEGKSYALISYMRNNSKETKKKLSGYVEYLPKDSTDSNFIFIPTDNSTSEPVTHGNLINKINEKEYEFTVDISNINGQQINWYVYRNGASYDFISTNSNTLKYSFKEPGTYTCIYRVKDKYFGEVDFNNFKQLIIE